jgi:hypothetical protein
MARKNVAIEWVAGRVASTNTESTNGTDLYSYGLLIGTRGIDGKTIAIRPYGVSQQTDAHMHYANIVADRVVWGIQGRRSSWYDVRTFVSDPGKVGETYSFKIRKSWSRISTAETHAARMLAADTNGSYKHGRLHVCSDGSGNGKYCVWYVYKLAARDLAYSAYNGFDYTDLIPLINEQPVQA